MAAKTTEVMSYTAGIGTVLSSTFGWLDAHALGIGAICAIVTCAANIYFRILERREKRRKRDAQR